MNEDWYTGLQNSNIFMPLVSDAYFKDAQATAQWLSAMAEGKPFRILLELDTEIPPEMLVGVKDVKIERFRMGDGGSVDKSKITY